MIFDGAMEDTRGQTGHGFQRRIKKPAGMLFPSYVPNTSRMSPQGRLRVFLSLNGTQVEHSVTLMGLTIYGLNLLSFS